MNFKWNVAILVLVGMTFPSAQGWASMAYDYQIDLGDNYVLHRFTKDAFTICGPDKAEILYIDPFWHHCKLTGYCKLDSVILAKATDVDEKGLPLPERGITYFIINTKENSCTKPLTETIVQENLAKMSLNKHQICWIAPKHPNPKLLLHWRIMIYVVRLIFCGGPVLLILFLLMLWHYSRLKKRLRLLEVVQEKHLPQNNDQVTGTGSV